MYILCNIGFPSKHFQTVSSETLFLSAIKTREYFRDKIEKTSSIFYGKAVFLQHHSLTTS